jgi:hypothetical protein
MRANGDPKGPACSSPSTPKPPALDPTTGFKYKGMLFSEVPKDYLEWLIATQLDEDMTFTVKDCLNRFPRDQG